MVAIGNVSGVLLPPTITGPIFKKAAETSAVMQLARRVPLAINANTDIPIPMDIGVAGWVNEGQAKPVASGGIGVKRMTGKKVALIVPVSEEVVRTNPGGVYEQLAADLPTAISRAFDYAAIHGLDLKSGGAGPFSDYLAQTPNTQVIGSTAASAGGVYTDLWSGVSKVVNAPTPGYEFSGFAADPRLRPELAMSTDAQGRPIMLDNAFGGNANQGFSGGSLIGYPTYYNPGVSGKLVRNGNSTQTVTVTGTPTGGTFQLRVGGAVTTPIAYNASGATVQAALQALSTVSSTNTEALGSAVAAGITVTGAGPYAVTFANGATPITLANNSLTGGTSPTVTIAQTTQFDSGLRAIGGDWSQAAWGQGMDITLRTSTDASYTPDGGTTWISAFQNNLRLFLVEAYFGFVMGDPYAFTAYTHAVGS
jgi:hypothetical protein